MGTTGREKQKRTNQRILQLDEQSRAGMKSQTVVVSVALLALCCLQIPRGGHSAGGIASLQLSGGEKQAEDQRSLDDPESEQGLTGDPHPLGSSIQDKRDTEEVPALGECRTF